MAFLQGNIAILQHDCRLNAEMAALLRRRRIVFAALSPCLCGVMPLPLHRKGKGKKSGRKGDKR